MKTENQTVSDEALPQQRPTVVGQTCGSATLPATFSNEVVGCAALIRHQKRGTGRKHRRGLHPDRVLLALRRKMEQEKSK